MQVIEDQLGEAPAAAERPAAKPAFRPDVDALRAVAIVLVVLYHAHVPGLSGGFIGVDVFFVISGYLITRNLIAEHADSGRIALGSFWGRRLRRLVPAMSVMVLATMVLGVLVLTPLRWGELAAQGVAASLYYANYHFAGLTNDYFASNVASSPLLHTWSLAVEEQFYLVWPIVFAGALALGQRIRRSQATLVISLAAIAIASFVLSTGLVADGSSLAFYGLPSRSWEFAVAGLLAVATTRYRGQIPAAAAVVLAVGGLAAIGWTAHTYDATTAFPGLAALLPVFGTIAVIAAGSWSTATWVVAVSPLRWLGRISYSWYLWHWPAMVLAVTYLDRDTMGVRLIAGLAMLPVAQLSLKKLEDPVRRSPRLVRSGWATAGAAAAFTLLALVGTVGVTIHRDQVQKGSFHKDLAAASEKDYLDDCAWSTDDHDNEICALGDVDSDRTIVLSGDSHAMSWAPGFDEAGKAMGVRVLVRAGNSCPGAPVPTMSDHTGELNQSCMEFRAGTDQVIAESDPETVILVSSDFTRRVADDDGVRIADPAERRAVWAKALRDMRDDLASKGIEMGAILDNPRIDPEPLLCMEEEHDLDACTPTRSAALQRVRRHIVNEYEALGKDATMNSVDLTCGPEVCDIWRDGTYVYADNAHLSSAFTRAHADDIEAFLRRLEQQK